MKELTDEEVCCLSNILSNSNSNRIKRNFNYDKKYRDEQLTPLFTTQKKFFQEMIKRGLWDKGKKGSEREVRPWGVKK